jgi:heme-degrading monooxygenase HmoA
VSRVPLTTRRAGRRLSSLGNRSAPATVEYGMIARWWRGWAATQENAEAYEELLRTTILPWVDSHEGHRGSYLVRRDVDEGVEFATLTLWDSLDAVKAFAGEDYELAVVPERARAVLARWDERSAHYEVVIGPEL